MKHHLYQGSDAFAWHARRWPQFAECGQPADKHIILPVYSIADWAMGRPLDSEEVVGSHFLDAALTELAEQFDCLVLPPFRFTPAQSIGTQFAVDIEQAHQALMETITSAAVPGFRRFILFNTSPFLEEWIDVAARDLRVNADYQMFCINLSGVGLDFHPTRGGERSALQAVLTELLGTQAETELALTPEQLDPIPAAAVKTNPALVAADSPSVKALMDLVTTRMVQLFSEISQHGPLIETVPDAKESE